MSKRRSDPAAVPQPPLPPDRAFVVQFRPQPESGSELFVGRVEHITSGAAGPFTSVDELVGFVAQVLAAAAGATGPSEEDS